MSNKFGLVTCSFILAKEVVLKMTEAWVTLVAGGSKK